MCQKYGRRMMITFPVEIIVPMNRIVNLIVQPIVQKSLKEKSSQSEMCENCTRTK
jgi:hypothetical protein